MTMSDESKSPMPENALHVMKSIVANAKAIELVNSLWKHFSGRIRCECVADDGQPSVLRWNVRMNNGIDTSELKLILRRNDRLEEALIHELLHADLYRRGYPKWFLPTQDAHLLRQGEDILNLAEHVVMLPSFLSLGYREERFVGRTKVPMSEEGQRVQADLTAMAESLSTPSGFVACVSEYLKRRGIAFEVPYWGRAENRE